MDSQIKGAQAEDRVLEEMEKRGYRLVKRRWRTPAAEIDLLVANLSEYLLIEVKTLSHWGFAAGRVSPGQKRRLGRAQLYLQELLRADVRLLFAYVRPDGKILLFNPGADDLH